MPSFITTLTNGYSLHHRRGKPYVTTGAGRVVKFKKYVKVREWRNVLTINPTWSDIQRKAVVLFYNDPLCCLNTIKP